MSLIALALATALSTAAPDAAENEADLRCVAWVASMIGSKEFDDEVNSGLIAGMTYFIGRIDGRTPGYNLKTGLTPSSRDRIFKPSWKPKDRAARRSFKIAVRS